MSGAGNNPGPEPIRAPNPSSPIDPLPEPPSFSVVIPAFEAAGTIVETVESVLAQSPPAGEIIVVDDGRDDDLLAAVAPFERRIRLLRQPHRGVAAARNAGLRESSGDFVLIVDADDALLPGRLAALGRLAQARPDLDILCTDVYFEVNGKREGTFYGQTIFPTDGQRQEILDRCFPIHPAARRSRLLEEGGFDEALRTAEDWDCALRMIVGGSLAGLYDEPLALYRIHSGSLTDSRPATLRDRVAMLEKSRANQRVRPEERRRLDRSLRSHRLRAALADAQLALAEDRTDVRSRGLELARLHHAPVRVRLWGLALFAAPRRLRNVLRHRLAGRSQLVRVLPTGDRV